MLLSKGTLTVQSLKSVDSVAVTMSTNKEIIQLAYSRDLTGELLPINPEIMRKLCEGFSKSSTARQFSIRSLHLNQEDVQQMEMLFAAPNLQTLILQDCTMNDDCWVALAAIILQSGHKQLRYLDLSGNVIGTHSSHIPRKQYDSTPGTKMLARLMVDKRVTLSTLNVSRNPLGNFGVHCLSQVLPHSSLREIDLSEVNLTPTGCACFIRVLRFSPSIVSLDLSHSIIGHQTYQQLIETLPKVEIQYLNLKDTHLDDLSLVQLGDALKANTTLVELDISSNPFCKESAQLFCSFLNQNETLQKITVTNSSIASIEVFVNAAVAAKAGKGDIPIREIDCLENDSLSFISPAKYITKFGIILSGVAFLLWSMGMEMFDNIMDILSVNDMISGGLVWEGIIFAIFIVASGNWDELMSDNEERDMIHLDTQEEMEILRAIVEATPSMIIDGFVLFVLKEETGIVVYLSFAGCVASLSWAISGYLSEIEEVEDLPIDEDIEEGIFVHIKFWLYVVLPLALNTFRICLVAGADIVNVVLMLLFEFFFWVVFYLVTQQPINRQYLVLVKQAFSLAPLTLLTNSETIFCSLKGRTDFFRYSRFLPRAVYVTTDLIMYGFQCFILIFHLIIEQQNMNLLIVFIVLLILFLNLCMILIRIVLEKNGASDALQSTKEMVKMAKEKEKKLQLLRDEIEDDIDDQDETLDLANRGAEIEMQQVPPKLIPITQPQDETQNRSLGSGGPSGYGEFWAGRPKSGNQPPQQPTSQAVIIKPVGSLKTTPSQSNIGLQSPPTQTLSPSGTQTSFMKPAPKAPSGGPSTMVPSSTLVQLPTSPQFTRQPTVPAFQRQPTSPGSQQGRSAVVLVPSAGQGNSQRSPYPSPSSGGIQRQGSQVAQPTSATRSGGFQPYSPSSGNLPPVTSPQIGGQQSPK
ncbi:MAG: hypothetical protein EZS28_018450, partial [Streblomastix strix]